MNQEKEILVNIADSVDAYNKVSLSDPKQLSEILRKISANIFYLTQYKVEARNKWHSVYKNSKATSNAGKTMTFDQFEKTYTGVLSGISFEDAYKAVGGEIVKAKKPSKKSKKED